ncbi:glycosyltransferase, partial [Pseudomonas syringae group genomosp. 7]|uniref:glycosyltransferase n=1 Tax=Pseudomonas syringae group genomosp. 7 TaxID=251699 RepID=UPI00376FD30E
MKPYPINFVSVVIPVYQERHSLPELLLRTETACEQLNHRYDIVLVDVGCRDDSAEILQQAAERARSPFVAVIL